MSIKVTSEYECDLFVSCKEKLNTDIQEQKLSMCVHPFERQWHLKNVNTLKMDSVIPPFWENPPPDFFGTFRTVDRWAP